MDDPDPNRPVDLHAGGPDAAKFRVRQDDGDHRGEGGQIEVGAGYEAGLRDQDHLHGDGHG